MEVAADALLGETHIAFGFEVSEFDEVPFERLCDDCPRDVTGVLAGVEVVEHPRGDGGDVVGVVEAHFEEVGRLASRSRRCWSGSRGSVH